jgi:hypothetical protein
MLDMGDSALRMEADAMTFVGCDLHTRTQQVAVLDTRAKCIVHARDGAICMQV